MKMRTVLGILLTLSLLLTSQAMAAQNPVEKLGKLLYFDNYLSLNQNQACATCHHPSARFADPLNNRFPFDYPVSFGSDNTLNGGRNAPTASYAAYIPLFDWNAVDGLFFGGQFWDGRAPTLKDQAKGPFLNPVEMAMADEAAVIAALVDRGNPKNRLYQRLFQQVYGINLQAIDTTWNSPEVLAAYDKLAEAIATFEQTQLFSPFSSKYDYYLAGQTTLTAQELNGLAIFEDPIRGNCAACHTSQPVINADGTIVPPMFTDFTYDNLGIPKSSNPLIAAFPVDYGLGARTNLNLFNPDLALGVLPNGNSGYPSEAGKFRVSTLRNLDKTAPYGHNGFFPTLADIVHFYNTRDVVAENWATPEVDLNVNRVELGNLGLTPQDETDLIAFLLTLKDGFRDAPPASYVLPPVTPLN